LFYVINHIVTNTEKQKQKTKKLITIKIITFYDTDRLTVLFINKCENWFKSFFAFMRNDRTNGEFRKQWHSKIQTKLHDKHIERQHLLRRKINKFSPFFFYVVNEQNSKLLRQNYHHDITSFHIFLFLLQSWTTILGT